MVRCFGYAEIAIEFSYIDERKQSRRSLVPLGFRHISSCTQSRPSVSSCAPLCEPLTDRGEKLYPVRAACVLGSPACSPALSGFRTNPRAARLLGDLLPVLGVPLRGFGGSFRVLGNLLQLVGGSLYGFVPKHFEAFRSRYRPARARTP